MSSDTIRFSRLKGRENYDTWKIAAKSYLVIKQCWSYIVNGLPADASAKQKEEDLMAWSQLNLLLEETIFSHIADTKTSKEAWDALESAFEDSGLCRKVDLLKQMVQLKLTDCISVEDYVNKMVMTSLKVKKAGLNFDDEIVASFMLAGLPEEFRPLVMAVENSGSKLTTDAVKNLLLQDPRLGSDNSGSGAFYSNRKEQHNFRCHYCGNVGHFAKACPEKTTRGESYSRCPAKTTKAEAFGHSAQRGEASGHSVRRGEAL